MKIDTYKVYFQNGKHVFSTGANKEECLILAQADAIKRGWPYKVIDFCWVAPNDSVTVIYSSLEN